MPTCTAPGINQNAIRASPVRTELSRALRASWQPSCSSYLPACPHLQRVWRGEFCTICRTLLMPECFPAVKVGQICSPFEMSWTKGARVLSFFNFFPQFSGTRHLQCSYQSRRSKAQMLQLVLEVVMMWTWVPKMPQKIPGVGDVICTNLGM